MTRVHVPGAEWPARCLGQPGGIRAPESLETDPDAPPWRLVTDWCFRPRSERRPVRRITRADIAAACPETEGRLF